MSRPPMPPESNEEPSIQLSEGWHCLHIYYQVDQVALNQLSAEERSRGVDAVCELLDENREGAPIRLQTSVVSGHRADLGLMMMDPDPLVIDRICQQLRATPLGPVLKPTYSFVSLTEISEYVPTVEQFSEKLIREGAKPEDPMFQARVKGYEQRLPAMNQQRIYPEIPPYPVVCFYPMNKIRVPEANWYDQPFSVRSELMAEHAVQRRRIAEKAVAMNMSNNNIGNRGIRGNSGGTRNPGGNGAGSSCEILVVGVAQWRYSSDGGANVCLSLCVWLCSSPSGSC